MDKPEIMPLEQVLKDARFRSTPAPFVNFFYGLKRPYFNVLRLSEECAKDMSIDLEIFKSFLDEIIIDLQILKPLAEEAYNINELIEQCQTTTEEMSPELKALFEELSRLTLWAMSCYSIYPKRYFEVARSCCISDTDNKIINIPARGIIQFLLMKMLGLILSWMVIQSHTTCIIDIEQKIDSVPSTLTPLIDLIHNVIHGKYLFLANTMVKKTCLWYKLLYRYSYNIPCADDHLSLDWDDYLATIGLKLPSHCSPFRTQCGPFKVFDLITSLHDKYFRLDKKLGKFTFKTNKDYPFKLMHIFGKIDKESDEESDLEHVKNTMSKIQARIEEQIAAIRDAIKQRDDSQSEIEKKTD